MAALRSVVRDEEKEEDSKRLKPKPERFPLNRWEFAAFTGVFCIFSAGLFCVYLTMPAAQYGELRLPRTLSDLRLLKNNLATYAEDYPAQFILGYCSTYIFMQTFMIPGTIFMSLLAGALFGVVRGVFLVVFNATAGASSCFFLSKMIGRPVVNWLWPDKLSFFHAEIAKRRDKLLNYMLFLRITPTLPNLFINLASPIVDIPFHVFFTATLIGIIPASYITVRTFMIPGTIFMSLLAGALFGVVRGVFLVVFNATAGASSCFFLSKMIGRPVVNWLWPDKLSFFHAEIAKRRDKLLNYMLFLRITPTLPNLFINLASPIVDIPFHVFFTATLIGIIPASYITVRAGLALGDLRSVKGLYDFKTLLALFLIGSVSIFPTLLKRKKVYE